MSKYSFIKKALFGLLLAMLIIAMTPKKGITWVAIGDSITYLNDHLDETGNRVSKGYLTRVREQLPYINYINQGHNGWTAKGIATNIEQLGLVRADIYTVFLGTNDWWSGLPLGSLSDYQQDTGPGSTYGAYRKIIKKIRSLNDSARIVLVTPMQRNDFVYVADPHNNAYGSYKEKNGQDLEAFAQAVLAIGEYEHLTVVDLYHNKDLRLKNLVKFKRLKNPLSGQYQNYVFPQFINIPFDPSRDDYPYPPEAVNETYDGLHPSDKGNAVIADKLIKVFKKLKIAE
jgi:lysophospholipase L1-like esterase